jgi:hypothetical protein
MKGRDTGEGFFLGLPLPLVPLVLSSHFSLGRED